MLKKRAQFGPYFDKVNTILLCLQVTANLAVSPKFKQQQKEQLDQRIRWYRHWTPVHPCAQLCLPVRAWLSAVARAIFMPAHLPQRPRVVLSTIPRRVQMVCLTMQSSKLKKACVFYIWFPDFKAHNRNYDCGLVLSNELFLNASNFCQPNGIFFDR